ncbi:hypothetical protein ScalyP_jg5187 [Parmales sp. scaly parma]|nr:hypothetical protein ScalyP_jg5187 [Parmales sp. scaly parma]
MRLLRQALLGLLPRPVVQFMFAQRQVQQRQVQQRQVQQRQVQQRQVQVQQRQVQQRQVQQRQVQQQQKVQQQKVQQQKVQQKVQQQQQGYDNIDIAKLAIVRMSNGAESSRVSASGLTGVDPAPITYVNSLSSNDNIPALMAEFYEALFDMRSKGEQHTSSMIFTAPSWDNNFESWHKRLFPVLEASILAAGLGREIGIVCFHPGYLTPAPDHLSRNPFGHLPSTKKLRSWLDEHDERFSSSMNDDELTLAASYQRKSPHAMINVLWSRQLEVAEQKRKSSLLYTQNIKKAYNKLSKNYLLGL